MRTQIVVNQTQPLGAYLHSVLNNATSVRKATAIFNFGWLLQVLNLLRNFLDRNVHISIVHGADLHITDTPAMRHLAELNTDCDTMT